MIVVAAVELDIPSWLLLAAEVEYLFGPMVNDPSFRTALEKNIRRGSAYCIREDDGPPGTPLMGGILFSPSHPHYKIGWLSVAEKWRRRGVGRALVSHVFNLVTRPADMSVTTFSDDMEDGMPALALYRSLGFVSAQTRIPGFRETTRQVLRREFQ